jgi:catechol 2,3-dioxygenase-like lactoylglutathione lyase family enzyme
MITGAHVLLYSQDPEADRAFFRDILGFRSVDAGGGWLIFALPPAELGIHPGDGKLVQPHADQPLLRVELYLMCDDLSSFVESLEAKSIECTPPTEAEWGIATTVRLPSGGRLGLYQPKHPTAF